MTRRALVIGAGGAVGEMVARSLADRGWRVTGSMRTKREGVIARLAAHGVSPAFHDIAQNDWRADAADADALVFATHLEVTRRALAESGVNAERLLVFSSNNVAVHAQTPVYKELAAAEASLKAHDPRVIIVRPTLIYGDPRLPTLPRLVAMARRWPLMPLPGSGKARVQPVFHEDLGAAAAGLAEDGDAGGVYAVGGPEAVTMRALFEAVARAAGAPRKPIVSIPRAALQLAAPIVSMFAPYSPAQAERADHDRLAVPQTPLPPSLAPRTPLAIGLARLVSALDGSPAGGR